MPATHRRRPQRLQEALDAVRCVRFMPLGIPVVLRGSTLATQAAARLLGTVTSSSGAPRRVAHHHGLLLLLVLPW